MNLNATAMRNTVIVLASFVGGIALAGPVGAQTLFTTEDYRADRERWTDPAYFGHNTARELTDMQVGNRYGERGSGEDRYTLTSPYEFETADEHYGAWLAAADGGTVHTWETLPDWSGLWGTEPNWLDSRGVQASSIVRALTPEYRQYYVQQAKAESEGRNWWATSFCLPDGFVRGVWRGPKEFILRPDRVWILSSMLTETQVRWIYPHASGHSPEDLHYPKWQGESIGFWDGTALVVHTNQIRQWNAGHSTIEWSDRLTAVERYERVGDRIEGEITLYDPIAFAAPLYAEIDFEPVEIPDFRLDYDTCTDTNGPSSNQFLNDEGILDERVPGDPQYWDPTDPRPWAKHYAAGE